MEQYQPKTIEPVVEEGVEPKPERIEVEGLPGTTKEFPIEEKPLAILKEAYIIEALGLQTHFEKDVDNTRSKVAVIDYFINQTIKKRGWKPNVKSYQDVLNEVLEKLNIHENELPLVKLNRIFDILEKVVEDEKLKKKIGLDIIPTFSGF